MHNTENTSIASTALHYIGNKNNDEVIHLSPNVLKVEDNVRDILTAYFTTSFKSNENFVFYHESDLSLNEVNNYVSKIFNTPECLYEQSVNLAKHLYEQSTHPKIKGGRILCGLF